MKFIDFITRIIFGTTVNAGYYVPEKKAEKDTYTLTSIFPSPTIEKIVLKQNR